MTMRIKSLRAKIRKEHTNEASPASSERETELYDQLDRIFLANQLYSYPGRYLKENPTDDRIAETLFKLDEDVLELEEYYGPRTAEIIFGTPMQCNPASTSGLVHEKVPSPPITNRTSILFFSIVARHLSTALT